MCFKVQTRAQQKIWTRISLSIRLGHFRFKFTDPSRTQACLANKVVSSWVFWKLMGESLLLKYPIYEYTGLPNTRWYGVTKYRKVKYLSIPEFKFLSIWLPKMSLVCQMTWTWVDLGTLIFIKVVFKFYLNCDSVLLWPLSFRLL